MMALLRATGMAGEAGTLRKSLKGETVSSKARNCSTACGGWMPESGESTTSARAFAYLLTTAEEIMRVSLPWPIAQGRRQGL